MSTVLTEPLATAPFYELAALVSHLTTEDDEPVDNLFSEKQQRLLTEPLYSSWTPPVTDDETPVRPFLAAANVGIFPTVHQPPLVPDMFLSLDVSVPDNWFDKEKRSYFFWEFGKVPEIVVEIVSNRKGNEDSGKLRGYARIRVPYYVIYDPTRSLSPEVLRVFELGNGHYQRCADNHLTETGLTAVLWQGRFEAKEGTWLRWADAITGVIIPTGAERAQQEATRADQETIRAEQEAARANQDTARADQETLRAEQEAARAEQATAKAARLAAKLRKMGLDPELL